MKLASTFLVATGILGMLAASALGQAPPSASPAKSVSRTTKAVNYRRAGAAKVDFQGTELMQQASGEARVQNKGSRTEIDAKFLGLDEATKFGLEYLTYVLWAVSPGGRAVNLGEVVLKNGAGEVKAISDMQTFGMIVTAEPYFSVTQPGNTVVLENVFGPATLGKVENIDASYELLGRGIYSSSNTKIENRTAAQECRRHLRAQERQKIRHRRRSRSCRNRRRSSRHGRKTKGRRRRQR